MTWQSIALLLFFPPLGALVWWLLSRGWALTAQGDQVRDQTRKRQKWLFWILLVAAYIVEIVAVLRRSKP